MTVKFYNREPWNLIIGLSYFAAIFIVIALLTSFWLLVVLPAVLAFFYIKNRVARSFDLWRKGYFSGRRHGYEWTYYERQGNVDESLTLKVENTEPGHYEIFIPNDSQWRSSVPSWAKDRREEIALGISEGWKKSDFHYPDDLQKA